MYQDASAPTLNWTPADGTQTTASSVAVLGKATDDTGVSEISVNGDIVNFSSTNSPSDLNEVEFTTSVALIDGANAIQVIAKDNADRSTSQTHTVKKSACAASM